MTDSKINMNANVSIRGRSVFKTSGCLELTVLVSDPSGEDPWDVADCLGDRPVWAECLMVKAKDGRLPVYLCLHLFSLCCLSISVCPNTKLRHLASSQTDLDARLTTALILKGVAFNLRHFCFGPSQLVQLCSHWAWKSRHDFHFWRRPYPNQPATDRLVQS